MPEPPTLKNAGIDKKLSSGAQKLAAIPEAKFHTLLKEWRERVGQDNERVLVKLFAKGEPAAKPQWKPEDDPVRIRFALLGVAHVRTNGQT